MPAVVESDNRAIVERFVEALASGDPDAYESALDEDALIERVIGDDPSWIMSPAYTMVRVEGSGEQFTATGRVRYPDGTEWHLVQLLEVRGGRISQVTSYFAEPFEAPAWRAPYRETSAP